ncbi:hypothetical protein [Gilvimarinus chinensis]|uniref:hypothetical protein n=1 Tax=Gilvimarinus chinensis TaxID=396005 RepID=UPI000379794E|nr:hypothetical protein [Gilvimarinus chinensis]
MATQAKKSTGNSGEQASMSEAFDKVKDASASVRDAVGAVGAAGAASARVKVEEGRERAVEYGSQAESYLRERPLLTVGVAFAAGWVVSRLLSGSNKS